MATVFVESRARAFATSAVVGRDRDGAYARCFNVTLAREVDEALNASVTQARKVSNGGAQMIRRVSPGGLACGFGADLLSKISRATTG